MKTINLRKLEGGYWQAEVDLELPSGIRHHVFPMQGASNTWHNIEILLNHGYRVDNSFLLAQLRKEVNGTSCPE